MEIKVTQNEVKINKDILNDGEYNIHKCQFDFDEEYNGLVQKAVFTLNDGSSYLETIVNNECNIPIEVLEEGVLKIGVYAYETNNDELVLRYSPSPDIIHVFDGSYVKDAQNSEGGTPTEYEQLESRVNDELDEMNKIADDLEEKVESGYFKGDKGDKGDPGAIKMIIVNELPATGEDDTIYLVPYTIITVEELPQAGLPHTIYTVNNKRYVYESSQWIEISNNNMYVEYIYVNNKWEELGGIGVNVDLSDYYTKQETNTLLDSKADVEDIPDLTDYVKNTDYATDNKGGVIKTNAYGLSLNANGVLTPSSYTYAQYPNLTNYHVISKGTLENVLNARIGDINTALDTINGEVI